jgi:hypothetical protein
MISCTTDQRQGASRRGRRTGRVAIALLTLAVSLAGCMHPEMRDPARMGPFFTPKNVVGEPTVGGIRRVVVLPLWVGADTPPESAAQLDEVFVSALQKQNRFEVVTLSRTECLRRFRAEALLSSSALPHNLLPDLQREFAADAVLFVDLTTFRAYKPLALGLRAKLAATADSRLVWSFDNLFAADDPATANGARNYFIDRDRSVPADMTPSALQSPTRFAEYAATAMFGTLPPVVQPIVVSKK